MAIAHFIAFEVGDMVDALGRFGPVAAVGQRAEYSTDSSRESWRIFSTTAGEETLKLVLRPVRKPAKRFHNPAWAT